MAAETEDQAEQNVGVTFVDLLFALVVAEILNPLRDPYDLTFFGWMHLAVALTATLLSWIGYHVSWNRVDERIRVANLPFFHLLLDIGMVILYWLTAVSYERTGSNDPSRWGPFPFPSALPEAILVSTAFLLYVVWDAVGQHLTEHDVPSALRDPTQIARRDKWVEARKMRARPRRQVTAVAFLFSIVAVVVSAVAQESSWDGCWITGVDVGLIVVLIAFRAGKDRWRAQTQREAEQAGRQYKAEAEALTATP